MINGKQFEVTQSFFFFALTHKFCSMRELDDLISWHQKYCTHSIERPLFVFGRIDCQSFLLLYCYFRLLYWTYSFRQHILLAKVVLVAHTTGIYVQIILTAWEWQRKSLVFEINLKTFTHCIEVHFCLINHQHFHTLYTSAYSCNKSALSFEITIQSSEIIIKKKKTIIQTNRPTQQNGVVTL